MQTLKAGGRLNSRKTATERGDMMFYMYSNTQSVTRNKSIFDLSIEKRRFCLFFLVMDEIIILVGKKLKINMRGPLTYTAQVKA